MEGSYCSILEYNKKWVSIQKVIGQLMRRIKQLFVPEIVMAFKIDKVLMFGESKKSTE